MHIETTEQRKQKVSREADWDDIIADKLVSKISKFETLLFRAKKKKFSFDGLRTDLYSIEGCK